MSLFTLLYVAPILGIIYYLFFWSRGRPTGGACVCIFYTLNIAQVQEDELKCSFYIRFYKRGVTRSIKNF